MKILLAVTALLSLAGFCSAQWIKQNVDTTASFRGLSVVNEKVIWASGTGGTVIRTTDGGKTWKVMTVPGAEKLDFRDIEAFDAHTAYILSIGNGESSRIYKTIDGGKTWTLQFKNTNEKAFFDALSCWNRSQCVAVSDPVDGRFYFIAMLDSAGSWKSNPAIDQRIPPAKKGEAAFAASGTCLATIGNHTILLGSGGADARVFRAFHGNDIAIPWWWQTFEAPFIRGEPSSGIFSISMLDRKTGVMVGGNYEKPGEHDLNLAFTADGGQSWTSGTGLTPLSGYRSGVTYVDRQTIVAVGTNGSDITRDGGKTWTVLGKEDLNAVQAKGKRAVWAVGPKGMVARVDPMSSGRNATRTEYSVHTPTHNVDAVRLDKQTVFARCKTGGDKCGDLEQNVEVRTVAAAFGNMKYVYSVSAGKIIGDGPTVSWNLANVPTGTYTITVGVSEPIFDGGRWEVLGHTVTKEVVVKECAVCN